MTSEYKKLLDSDSGKRALFLEHAIVNVTELIAKLLKKHEMNQKALAEKMGVTEGRVAQIMNGRNLTLSTIAKALGAFDHILDVSSHPIGQRSSTWTPNADQDWTESTIPTVSYKFIDKLRAA